MLVLTRKMHEAVIIDERIEVYVVSVTRGKVKLGFKAPRSVTVRRAEVGPGISPPSADEQVEVGESPVRKVPIDLSRRSL